MEYAPDRQSWERQPGETAKAYAAFRLYLQLPPSARSLRAAWKERRNTKAETTPTENSVPNGTWTAWYTRWEWKSRAAAYDRYVAAKELAALEAQRAEERQTFFEQEFRIARLYQQLQAKGLDEAIRAGKVDRQLAMFLKDMSRVQRNYGPYLAQLIGLIDDRDVDPDPEPNSDTG